MKKLSSLLKIDEEFKVCFDEAFWPRCAMWMIAWCIILENRTLNRKLKYEPWCQRMIPCYKESQKTIPRLPIGSSSSLVDQVRHVCANKTSFVAWLCAYCRISWFACECDQHFTPQPLMMNEKKKARRFGMLRSVIVELLGRNTIHRFLS
jgi:hypothetical protein